MRRVVRGSSRRGRAYSGRPRARRGSTRHRSRSRPSDEVDFGALLVVQIDRAAFALVPRRIVPDRDAPVPTVVEAGGVDRLRWNWMVELELRIAVSSLPRRVSG